MTQAQLASARGWAIQQGADLLVESVSPTRFGAIVYWLWKVPQVEGLNTWIEPVLLEIWDDRRGKYDAQAVQVTIIADAR